MVGVNFVWPPRYISHDAQGRVEAILSERIRRSYSDLSLCHQGDVDVHFAYAMPLNGNVDGVLVCACGAARTAFRGSLKDDAAWQFTEIVEP